jgi:glucose/arabinose dehydrogenase
MPGWAGRFDAGQLRSLAILIAEQRVNRRFSDFKVDKPLALPRGVIETQHHAFHLEDVAQGLDASSFSIAPLPDGRILVTEKVQGLSIVSPDGTRSAPVTGTPQTSGFGFTMLGLDYGVGWLLDVKPHPDYARNGWIYLVHSDLCAECKPDGDAWIPKTMVRLVRGRIDGDQWVDQEVIWNVPQRFYSPTPDIAAGGRLSFDPQGYVFVSVGIKGNSNFRGVQDLATPYGKVHRLHDDGRIPVDNPFATTPGAMASIFTYGHRSPQGLEFDPATSTLWETEMGPRGGDEVNVLVAGRNYGWPLYSMGVDYDGTPVEYWKDLGLELDLDQIEQPRVDLTPSPAVSSFVVYDGAAFPAWRGHLLVGSLKATELYRFEPRTEGPFPAETLLEDLARIRDIEVAPDGTVLLLLEHSSGSRIVRMVSEQRPV